VSLASCCLVEASRCHVSAHSGLWCVLGCHALCVQPVGVWVGHEEVVVLVGDVLIVFDAPRSRARLPTSQIQTTFESSECLRVTFDQPTQKQLAKAAKIDSGAGSGCVVA
jgi:hypothetical protein